MLNMRNFLDIGSHSGETLSVVVDPKYKFDRIYGFEPSLISCKRLQKYTSDPRVEIICCALGMKTGRGILYHSGSLGATMYEDKPWRPGNYHPNEECDTLSASTWFRKLSASDDNVVKINCEGAELDILDDLMDSGEIAKIKILMVDWDSQKIPSLKSRVKITQDKLADWPDIVQFPVPTRDMGETHDARTRWWVDQAINILDERN
jgi:FkbM family methyltransferase